MSTLVPLKQKSAQTNPAVLVRKTAPGSKSKRTSVLALQPTDESQPKLVPTAHAPIQTKLEVSQPGDELEQEADRVAAQVMRAPTEIESAGPAATQSSDLAQLSNERETAQREAELTGDEPEEAVQRACSSCMQAGADDEELQRKVETPSQWHTLRSSAKRTATGNIGFATALGRARTSGGESLPAPVRTLMEPRFGKSFGEVRLHRDANANELAKSVQAKAFTVGRDLFFREGQFEPGNERGQRLIAHELTHVLQQQAGLRSVQREVVQREANDEGAQGSQTAEVSRGLITDDEVTTLGPGQVRKREFLAQLRVAVCDAADRELTRVGRDTRGCPYIERWLAYYAERAASQVERAIRKFVPAASRVVSALEYLPLVAARVAQGVRQWAQTGELPEDLPPELRTQIVGGSDIGQVIASAAANIGGAISSAVSAVGSAIGGVLSGIGSLFFKSGPGRVSVGADPSTVGRRLGPGRPLEGSARARMESALGADLGGVRVHDDTGAAMLTHELGAHAFALGEHVAFGAGNYRPGTPVGDALLAHELAHVVQQQGAGTSAIAGPEVGVEQDADRAAAGVVAALYAPEQAKIERRPRLRTRLRLSRCAGAAPEQKQPETAPKAEPEKKATAPSESTTEKPTVMAPVQTEERVQSKTNVGGWEVWRLEDGSTAFGDVWSNTKPEIPLINSWDTIDLASTQSPYKHGHPVVTIKVSYSPSDRFAMKQGNPNIQQYGYGANKLTVQDHEEEHVRRILEFLRRNAPPVFGGKKDDAARNKFNDAYGRLYNQLTDYHIRNTDCTGRPTADEVQGTHICHK